MPNMLNRYLLSFGSERLDRLNPIYRVFRRRDPPIYRQGDIVDHFYFMDSGLCSTLCRVPGGSPAVTIWVAGGTLGLIGIHTLFFPRPECLYEYRTQMDQTGWQVSRAAILKLMAEDSVFDIQFREIYQVARSGIGQLAVCRTDHKAEQRFCRLLLMIRESIETDHITLPLATLARMVPMSTGRWWNKDGLADHLAGVVTFRGRSLEILDLAALQRLACPCYRAHRRKQASVIGGNWQV